MKKLLVLLLAVISLSATAQHRHHPHHPHWVWKPGMGWVIPSIVSGVVVYEIVKAQQQPAPIVIEKQVVCTEWKEIQTPEGKTYRERSCREENLK